MDKKLRALCIATLMSCADRYAMADSDALILAGKNLASQHCSACHQTLVVQRRPPPVAAGEDNPTVQAPTFTEVAARCMTDAQLRDKISVPHYPMREQWLENEEIGKLVAYIQSLVPVQGCPAKP